MYLQNENGPCPLLALCNVLILSGRMKIPPGETLITSTHLLDLLGACLIESHPGDTLTDGERANYEQNVQDAMSIFPKLQTGLDVNVRFNRYIPPCSKITVLVTIGVAYPITFVFCFLASDCYENIVTIS